MPVSTQTELSSDARLHLRMRRDALAVISLFVIGCSVYGIFVHMLGYYWDDWPVVWVYNALGREGVSKYFAGLRPVYGWLFAIAAPVLGRSPIGWQVLALAIRCAACATWYVAFSALWPKRRDVAWLIGAFALLFPGFTLQPVALSLFQYQMSFLFFALSVATTILAIKKPSLRWLFLAVSLLSGAFSYLIMEYFLGLELFRFLIIVVLTRREYATWNLKRRMRTALLRWSPYAALWAAYFVWRAFLFRVASNYTSAGYMDVGSDLAPILKSPFHELLSRMSVGVHNILMATVFALIRPITPDLLTFNAHAGVLSLVMISFVIAIGIYTLRHLTAGSEVALEATGGDQRECFVKEALLLGLGGLAVAELPLLASNLEIAFTVHPAFSDRWTLPFMIPASLILSCLLTFLDKRSRSKVLVLSSLLFLFSAFQIQNERTYHQDWLAQKSLFWQLAWRAPALKEGTGILVEGMPRSLYGNHTSGILDLLYKRDDRSGHMDYFIFDLTGVPWSRAHVSYRPGDRMVGRVRWFTFQGNTDQALVSWVSPSGVLRVVSPAFANEVLECSALCDNISYLSRPEEFISDAPGRPDGPLFDIFGSEPRHDWPYFYQKAELQRQFKHWKDIAALGDQVDQDGYRPDDPSEWLPFIEGYARANRFDRAVALTNAVLTERPDALPALSSLWLRVKGENPPSPEEDNALRSLGSKLWFAQAR